MSVFPWWLWLLSGAWVLTALAAVARSEQRQRPQLWLPVMTGLVWAACWPVPMTAALGWISPATVTLLVLSAAGLAGALGLLLSPSPMGQQGGFGVAALSVCGWLTLQRQGDLALIVLIIALGVFRQAWRDGQRQRRFVPRPVANSTSAETTAAAMTAASAPSDGSSIRAAAVPRDPVRTETVAGPLLPQPLSETVWETATIVTDSSRVSAEKTRPSRAGNPLLPDRPLVVLGLVLSMVGGIGCLLALRQAVGGLEPGLGFPHDAAVQSAQPLTPWGMGSGAGATRGLRKNGAGPSVAAGLPTTVAPSATRVREEGLPPLWSFGEHLMLVAAVGAVLWRGRA